MARVLVPLAEGFEEIETATIVDVLRRGGVDVVLAGIAGAGPCRGSRGLEFVPDAAFADAEGPFDLVVIPGGGKGVDRLVADERVISLVQARAKAKEPVAAICAGPRVLDAAGVLSPGQFTCYPGVQQQIKTPGRRNDAVVDTGFVITSQGPGTAIKFALHLVARLSNEETRDHVARALLVTA